VGDELLRGHTVDTNTNWLAQRLYSLGYPARRVHIVSDEETEIVRWLQTEIAEKPACLFLCGGLGPTPDDKTLVALGQALDRPLALDPVAAGHIQKRLDWLHDMKYIASPSMSEANRRMGEVPEGSVILNNSMGMAPGLAIAMHAPGEPERHIFVLPGVPRELKNIFDEEIAPRYLAGGRAFATAEVHFHRAVEAQFWDLLTRVGREFPEVSVGSYPQPDRGHLIIRISGTDANRVNEAAAMVRRDGPADLHVEDPGNPTQE
jgi:molybdopterin-biosynthesis enzyme MoeA-like protein